VNKKSKVKEINSFGVVLIMVLFRYILMPFEANYLAVSCDSFCCLDSIG